MFQTCPIRSGPQGGPRTCWRDYNSYMLWECLDVPMDKLEEVAEVYREVWVALMMDG